MSLPYETKDLLFSEIKQAGGDEGVIEGFAAIFGNVDHQGDRIHPGAFTRTIASPPDGLPQLMGWQHNLDHPFGRSLEIREVGPDRLPASVLSRAPEATGGLFVRGKVALSSPINRDRLALLKDPVKPMNGASIGYDAVVTELTDQDGRRIREIKEVRLWEWSPVALGANVAAGIVSAKSRESRPKMFDGCDPTEGCFAHHYKLPSPFQADLWAGDFQEILDFLNRTPDHYAGGVKVRTVWIVRKPDPNRWRKDRDPAPLAWSNMVDRGPVMFVDIGTLSCPKDRLAVAHEWWHGQELASCVSPGSRIEPRYGVGEGCNERAVEFGKWFRDWWTAPMVLNHGPDRTASRQYFDGDGPAKVWRTIPPEWGHLLGRPVA